MLQCKWRIVTVAKSGVTLHSLTASTVDFERSIKQCMESVIAFYQNVLHDNDYL